jgi:hypothetical protein
MQSELIHEVLQCLDKFEKTGDWFHFSLALDALGDLKRAIENSQTQTKTERTKDNESKP